MAEQTREELLAAFAALPVWRRRQALVVACRDALAVWERAMEGAGPLEYTDDATPGRLYTLDLALPARALAEVEAALSGERTAPQETWLAYRDPILAMREEALVLAEPLALAYCAIYDLHQLVFAAPDPPDPVAPLLQAAGASQLPELEWLREWWLRVWDRWATGEPQYPPSAMTRGAFYGLSDRDPARALRALPTPCLLRAIVRRMAGDAADALDEAAAVLGAHAPAHRAWLEQHLDGLAPDAIALARETAHYAVVWGDQLAMVYPGQSMPALPRRLEGTARRVRFSPRGVVWVVGDTTDDIGVDGTFWFSEQLGDRSPGHDSRRPGTRTIAALGDCGDVLPCDEQQLRLLAPAGDRGSEAARVLGAAFTEDGALAATHDGREVSLWREGRRVPGGSFVPEAPPVAVYAGGAHVLVRSADNRSRLYRFDGTRDDGGEPGPSRGSSRG